MVESCQKAVNAHLSWPPITKKVQQLKHKTQKYADNILCISNVYADCDIFKNWCLNFLTEHKLNTISPQQQIWR